MVKTTVTIISGFLGSGKTTLIKELLQEKVFGSDPILIENDYGTLGIDSLLMKETGIVVEEVDSGCICCSLTGQFKSGVEQILNKYRPEHLIIEPSGVGKLSKIFLQLQEVELPEDLVIERMTAISVVDASRFDHNDQYVNEYFWDQIKQSNAVLINRSECIHQKDYDRIFETLYTRTHYSPLLSGLNTESIRYLDRYINSDSAIIDQKVGGIPAAVECECGCAHHHEHNENSDFQSWSTYVSGFFSENALESLGDILQDDNSLGEIMRAKGIFPGSDQSYLFDYVPGQGTVQEIGVQEKGWVMVIGRSLDENSLEHLFNTKE